MKVCPIFLDWIKDYKYCRVVGIGLGPVDFLEAAATFRIKPCHLVDAAFEANLIAIDSGVYREDVSRLEEREYLRTLSTGERRNDFKIWMSVNCLMYLHIVKPKAEILDLLSAVRRMDVGLLSSIKDAVDMGIGCSISVRRANKIWRAINDIYQISDVLSKQITRSKS